jgi:hypothetical protein
LPEGSHPDGRERASRPRAALSLRRELILPALAGLASLACACDAGPYHDQTSVGPAIQLVSSNIQGSGYTLDQPITLTFSRFLDPNTVTRQSIYLETAGHIPVTEATVSYDPVTLTVSLSNPGSALGWLVAGQDYDVVLNVASTTPTDGATQFGLMAIDGASLSRPQTISFTAGAPPSNPMAGPPTMDFCRDIYTPIFSYSCGYNGCHGPATPVAPAIDGGTGYPRLGLDLSSPSGVRTTAVNQVADESNTGPNSTTAAQLQGTPFGIDMAVITPGQPGNSWMVYKTLLATPTATEAAGFDAGNSSYDQGLKSPITDSERAILSNYILGQSMPYPAPATIEPAPGLTEGDMERLSLWIAQGATIPASCP